MTYDLSVVNIIPIAYLNLINALAEAYGCGPNNTSVPLCNKDGEITHYGCHSFWRIEDYAAFTGDAQENWQAALAELGLTEHNAEKTDIDSLIES